MSLSIDYYYNENFDFKKVIDGECDFLGCFIMTVNNKYIINDYEKYPENIEYALMDWITWLGIQFMRALHSVENCSGSFSYIHFLEYFGGK